MIKKRFPAVDYFRGFILVLLAAEGAGVYSELNHLFPTHLSSTSFSCYLGRSPFLDLFQPGFMMIAGAALYFSTYKRLDEGATYATLWPKVLKRAILLLFLV